MKLRRKIIEGRSSILVSLCGGALDNLISINQRRIFSLTEARSVLQLIYRITEQHHAEVKVLANRLRGLRGVKPDVASQLESEINVIVEKWNSKVSRLGANPKGLWLADFDNGNGYYCWKFPETEIQYHHGYHEGFSGRTPIEIM